VIRTGPATDLIKVGRFKASVASKYPWQYLRAQYLPRTNGQGQILLMRHIANENASKTNQKVANYERLVLSYMRAFGAKVAHGAEWFRDYPKILNKVTAAMNRTNENLKARARNDEWMGRHQKGSPGKAPQPSTKAVIKTTKLGKAKGKNHIAQNYVARRPILTRAEFRALGLEANAKNPDQFPSGNGHYYKFTFPKTMGGGVKYVYRPKRHGVTHV
jgi:hypothetical protein